MATDIPDYTIRPMREEEIPAVLDIWRETGLSEGTYSVYTWFGHDPEGFFVAATDQGEILGVCAGILQNPDLAFVGMYAVKSTYQRKGIGIKIWKAVMDRIGERNAGVNPVPDQLENYRDKAGFPLQASWCSVICVAKDILPEFTVKKIPGIEVRQLSPEDAILNDVIVYDSDINGCHWNNLVQLMCSEKNSVIMVAVDLDGNTVCGYGKIKENIKGNGLVGPLYADNADLAELILHRLVEAYPLAQTEGVTLHIVDQNHDAVRMTEKLGFKNSVGVARLYRSAEVPAQFHKIFGQHNLNFAVF